MKHSIFLFTLIILNVSCITDKEKIVEFENFSFETSDASELYFKNIRESYYHLEEKGGLKIYRLKKYDDLDTFLIKPILIYNWRNDLAYVMLESNGSIDLKEEIVISWKNESRSWVIRNIKDHFSILNHINNLIKKDETIWITIKGKKILLFSSILEKSYFSLILYDLHKITNYF